MNYIDPSGHSWLSSGLGWAEDRIVYGVRAANSVLEPILGDWFNGSGHGTVNGDRVVSGGAGPPNGGGRPNTTHSTTDTEGNSIEANDPYVDMYLEYGLIYSDMLMQEAYEIYWDTTNYSKNHPMAMLSRLHPNNYLFADLTLGQTAIVNFASAGGAAFGSLLGPWTSGGVSALAGMGTTIYFGGDRYDVANSGLNAFLSGVTGTGLANFFNMTSRSWIQSAFRAGVTSGAIDSTLFFARPFFGRNE